MSAKELEKFVNEQTKQEQKEMFLQLRIQGYTFAEISKRLGKSKQTMINWSKEPAIKEAIDEAR
jgi:transposase